ncbi:hypothetical protein ABVT39_016029 [Epinephelus coioides]
MEENDKISAAWKEDNNGKTAAFEEDVKEIEAECVTKLREVKDKWQRKVNQLQQTLRKKGSKIRPVTKRSEAQTDAHLTLALLSVKEDELNQSETEWKGKCAGLEEGFGKELGVKETLEREDKQLEDMELAKQEEWIQKACKAKLLMVEKNQLQKLTFKEKKGKKKGGFWTPRNKGCL